MARILEREGWIVEADKEKEKFLKATKSKSKSKPKEDQDDVVKYYCNCRQVCTPFKCIVPQ